MYCEYGGLSFKESSRDLKECCKRVVMKEKLYLIHT